MKSGASLSYLQEPTIGLHPGPVEVTPSLHIICLMKSNANKYLFQDHSEHKLHCTNVKEEGFR